ncbi:MAG: NAD-dependent epimerase/dehydratase family protein [Thermoplasmata archaeon]|nr:NAD-dependent epimerase/dehydratase family protein [Thermoplasmata archaeon]
MSKERVLVTGGGGYIGSVLTRVLLRNDYHVRILDKFTFGIEPIADIINHPNIDVIIGDIRKIDDLKKVIKNVDYIVHLAAIVGDPACSVQGDIAVETNFLSTIRLARLARENDIKRFVFASTCSVYGTSNADIVNEESLTNPVSLYAETKLDAEKELLTLLGNKPALTILRFGTAYGLSPRMRFDLVINYFTKKALLDKEIKIFGGEQWRPFVHIYDISRAIKMVLDADEATVKGEIFNVGSTKENYRMKEIGNIIKEIIPDTNVEIVKQIKDKRSYRVSFKKIENTLGFKNEKTVKDGTIEIKDAIESGIIENPDNDKYYNHKRG